MNRTFMAGRGKKINPYQKRRIIITVAVLLVLLTVTVVSHYLRWNADVSFHFIDVGQGDAALILTDEAAIVIDAGPVSSGGELVSYIEKYTDKIDCLVISHPHEDHMGGAAELISSLDVAEVLMTVYDSDAAFYSRALDAMSEKNVKITIVSVGETYTVGDVKMTVLSPSKDYGDKNNNSIVLRAEVDGVSALFTGDAETIAEEDILDGYSWQLNSDILKVGHHGSYTSSSEKFLDAVSPEYAVISCGKDNSYGHPHQTTLNKLKARGVEYYRTDEDSKNGAVIITVKDGELSVK